MRPQSQDRVDLKLITTLSTDGVAKASRLEPRFAEKPSLCTVLEADRGVWYWQVIKPWKKKTVGRAKSAGNYCSIYAELLSMLATATVILTFDPGLPWHDRRWRHKGGTSLVPVCVTACIALFAVNILPPNITTHGSYEPPYSQMNYDMFSPGEWTHDSRHLLQKKRK